MAEGDDSDSGGQTIQIPFRVSPRVADYLDDLIKTGLFGSNRTAVVRQLMMDGIRKAVADQQIAVRKARPKP